MDNFILAELPDKTSDPETYRVVADMMMHGPCGNAKPIAPCMQEGACKKKFPKNTINVLTLINTGMYIIVE